MIERIHNFWGIESEYIFGDMFTGYEDLYPELDTFTAEVYEADPKDTIEKVFNIYRNRSIVPIIYYTENGLIQALKEVDVLTINDEEAQQLSGEHSLVLAAKKIQKMGPKYLIIKKGEHGALLFEGENKFFAPALPIENVFDPTGAGDSFAGGFIGYLSGQSEINFDMQFSALGLSLAQFSPSEQWKV